MLKDGAFVLFRMGKVIEKRPKTVIADFLEPVGELFDYAFGKSVGYKHAFCKVFIEFFDVFGIVFG